MPVFLVVCYLELFLRDPKLEILVKILIRPCFLVVVALSLKNL